MAEKPNEPEGPAGPVPRAPSKLFWVLLAVLGGLLAVQWLSPLGSAEGIRYDQFKRFVREGRVEWVNLRDHDIQGGFHQDKIPTRHREHAASEPFAKQFSTGRVDDDSLVPLLEEHKVAFRAVQSPGWGGGWLLLFFLLLSFPFLMMMLRQVGGPAGSMLSFGKSRGKVFQERDVSVSFADVAGVDEAKVELQEIIEFLQSPAKYKAIGAKIPKGVLLVGPPGTGKTLLARAVAGEAKVPFISINGSEFVEMFVGVGAARVRDLFEQAERSAPCIVFIDELDAIGRSRGGAGVGPGGHEEREQTLNQLLVEMDGFAPKKAVIIMSATNRPEILDPALLRPGRFDRQVLVDRPDKAGRAKILAVHVRAVKLDPTVELEVIASRTPGFAGADLANLVNEAALLAARRGRESVSMDEFSDAIDRVVAGLEKKSRIITDDEKQRIAVHESGHALASVLAGSDERIHKVSIIPRGIAALGYTMQMPERDRYLVTESELHTKLVGLLGGRAAEEVVFGEATTGARNDLQAATDLARAMVTEYGMSEAVGLVSIARTPSPFLMSGAGAPHPSERSAGVHLWDTVDVEVRRLVREAHAEAVKLLRTHRAMLDRLSRRLIEREQLEGEELDLLLALEGAPTEEKADLPRRKSALSV